MKFSITIWHNCREISRDFWDTASNLLLQGLDSRGIVNINFWLKKKQEKKVQYLTIQKTGLSWLTVKPQQQIWRQIQIFRSWLFAKVMWSNLLCYTLRYRWYKTGVQNFMPTKPTTIQALKEEIIDTVSQLCQTVIENFVKRTQAEDIYLMCCSIHNSHVSLWLKHNCVFSKKNVFYLKLEISALVGTPYSSVQYNTPIFNIFNKETKKKLKYC